MNALTFASVLVLLLAAGWLVWGIRRRSDEDLRRSEARYRLLYTDAADSIFTVSLDGHITAANPATERLGGYTMEDWRKGPFLRVILPESREAVGDVYRRLLAGEVVTEFEYGMRKKHGGELYLSASFRPVWKNGRVVQVEGIARDITARRREERARRALEEQVRQMQKMEAVGTLAGGIAHDFNNLLTGILGGVQLAQIELGDRSPVQEHLQQIEEAAERAAELTQQLLSLSRRRPLERGPTDVNEVLRRTARLLRRSIRETIEVRVRAADELPLIESDAGQLGQAILNLGINARDAIADAGTIHLETELVEVDEAYAATRPRARPGRYVCVTVSDSGAGMTPEIQQHAFEPFYTTKPEGQGTGLGLSMVYGCARDHGGWVNVYSEPGHGSTFRLYLPLVEAPEERVSPASDALPGGHETLLLVDDTEGVLVIGRRLLERCGYRVLLASNGEEALKTFEGAASEISLVVSDLVMPHCGGRDLLRALRQRGSEVPVILTTGYAVNSRREEFEREGFAAVVAKPFDLHTLAGAVRRVLDDQDPELSR